MNADAAWPLGRILPRATEAWCGEIPPRLKEGMGEILNWLVAGHTRISWVPDVLRKFPAYVRLVDVRAGKLASLKYRVQTQGPV